MRTITRATGGLVVAAGIGCALFGGTSVATAEPLLSPTNSGPVSPTPAAVTGPVRIFNSEQECDHWALLEPPNFVAYCAPYNAGTWAGFYAGI